MSTAAITGVNASLAATAAIEEDRAHQERCKAELAAYQPGTASVAQMQSYAECVHKLHPSEESTAMYKVCIMTVLVCAVIGAIVGSLRSYGEPVMDAIGGGLAGVMVAVVGLFVTASIIFVIYA